MKELSKEDQERIRKAALDMLCDGDTIPTFFEGAQYEHPIAYNKALEEVKKHHINMRNLMSFWDDETGDKLKYVESHMELLKQLIEGIEKLKR